MINQVTMIPNKQLHPFTDLPVRQKTHELSLHQHLLMTVLHANSSFAERTPDGAAYFLSSQITHACNFGESQSHRSSSPRSSPAAPQGGNLL